MECKVSVPERVFERFRDKARFDFNVIPLGYTWIFPKRRHLSARVLTTRPDHVNLNRCLEKYRRLCRIDPIDGLERNGFVIPISPRKSPLVKERVLLAGDAAGLADPVTGEKISCAIRSGQLATRALSQGRLWKGKVLSELRLARMLRVPTYTPSICRRLFRWQGQRLCEAVTDLLMGETTHGKILSALPNYLKLLRAYSGLRFIKLSQHSWALSVLVMAFIARRSARTKLKGVQSPTLGGRAARYGNPPAVGEALLPRDLRDVEPPD